MSEKPVVVKLESVKGTTHTLSQEFRVYMKLSRGIGIPRAYWFGTEGGFNAMVLDCLGPSLEALFVRCQFKFTVQTVLLLTNQLVCIFSF